MRLRKRIDAGLAIPAVNRDVIAPIAKSDSLSVCALETMGGSVEIPRRKLREGERRASPNDMFAQLVAGARYRGSDSVVRRHVPCPEVKSHCDFDERRSRPEVDGIAEGAQLSHSGGYPMSQQTNSGFNAPGFSVGADDPIECLRIATNPALLPASLLPSFALARLVGVGHIDFAIVAMLPRTGPTRPAAPPWFDPYCCAVGVGQTCFA